MFIFCLELMLVYFYILVIGTCFFFEQDEKCGYKVAADMLLGALEFEDLHTLQRALPVSVIVRYEDLTKDFRRGLWRTFLFKARTLQGPAVVEEEDIQRLESLALNGRDVSSILSGIYHLLTAINQIKNIAAVAHALAEADTTQISYKYLELAAKSNKKFSKEFGRQGPVDGTYI